VFLSAGGAERVVRPALDPALAAIFTKCDWAGNTVRMGGLLANRHYPSLKLKTKIFDEETHFTMSSIYIPHGLRYVFQQDA
jgi:hypothetical protein